MAAENAVVRRIATVVTLLCVAIVAITVVALASPSLRTRLGLDSLRRPAYPVGTKIDLPENLYSTTVRTLFVFIRNDCSACQAAKPAVSRIALRLAEKSVPTRVLASAATPEGNAAYVSEVGLPASQLVTMSLSGLQLHVVPTLVLVDQQGRVLWSTEGAPTEGQEQELITAAAALVSGR